MLLKVLPLDYIHDLKIYINPLENHASLKYTDEVP